MGRLALIRGVVAQIEAWAEFCLNDGTGFMNGGVTLDLPSPVMEDLQRMLSVKPFLIDLIIYSPYTKLSHKNYKRFQTVVTHRETRVD